MFQHGEQCGVAVGTFGEIAWVVIFRLSYEFCNIIVFHSTVKCWKDSNGGKEGGWGNMVAALTRPFALLSYIITGGNALIFPLVKPVSGKTWRIFMFADANWFLRLITTEQRRSCA
jgi:hypothetical protein